MGTALRSKRFAPLGTALGAAVLALLFVGASSATLLAAVPSTPYSSSTTGAVNVVLPAALPLVNLSQTSDRQVDASLELAKIVELQGATNSSTVPMVVAAAFESRVHAFNSTAFAADRLLAGLYANLTVYRDSGPLFPLANSDSPVRPLVPIAPTTLTVLVYSTSSPDVVNVTATVSNWPWVASGDVLAIGWEFGVAGETGFAGCAGARAATVPSTPCGENAFAQGNSTWGWNGFEAIQGLSVAGPESQLEWGPNVSLGPSGSAPIVAGAERTSAADVEVVYGAAGHGASELTFGLWYALVAPVVPPLLLHGAIVPYVAGIGGAALLGAAGLYAARRRDRRLLDGL